AFRIDEEARRAVRDAERRFKVVFTLLIFRHDFLLLFYQEKSKEKIFMKIVPTSIPTILS
ncbi:hypothetical protein, partial [Flavobacterium sp.]|uniref:hypothetical protein n=1 Tax=Flavobacterium sp. TaxID=239 RepID=UPI003D6BF009